MELSSSVTSTWYLCTIGSVFGCLVVLLFINKNDQILNFWASTTSIQVDSLSHQNAPITFSSLLLPPPNKPIELSTFSPPPKASVIDEPSNFSPSLSPPPSEASVIIPKPLEHSNSTNNSIEPPIARVVKEPSKPSINVTSTNAIEKTYHPKKPTSSYPNNIGLATNKVKKKCNMYDGRWVYKPDGKPSYMASQCPFMEEKMSCQRNKRPDLQFEKWSWEANDCDIPLLNGTDMVERFRNKRVIFVGDSLNRNMWESLSCILYSNIPNASSKVRINFEGVHRRTFLKAKDEYNFTVEFFWTPYLVEHNTTHSSGKKVLVLDKLSPNSAAWVGADIMIFNSGMHWIQRPPKKGWDLYEYNGKLIKNMPLHIAYKRGMKTWAKWVQKNVDPKKTSIFFRSVSAEHLNKKKHQWCVGKTKPIMDESYVSSYPKYLIRAIEDVIKGMRKSQVKYLNVTKLSRYRIDAHPSIYRYNDWPIRAKKDLSGLQGTADCGHWCLPGVPDTWNRLLYANLYFDSL